jgi:tetratricopeptide (TPR) repeat protein
MAPRPSASNEEMAAMPVASFHAIRARDGARSNDRAVEAIYAAGHWLLCHERIADAAEVFRVMLKAAPRDERAWLGLGECHERIAQPLIALELYGAGMVVAGAPEAPSVRCFLARARTLSKVGRDAEGALDAADAAAEKTGDDELIALVRRERARLS